MLFGDLFPHLESVPESMGCIGLLKVAYLTRANTEQIMDYSDSYRISRRFYTNKKVVDGQDICTQLQSVSQNIGVFLVLAQPLRI